MESDNLKENKIFRLADGRELANDEVQKLIKDTCHYVKYVVLNKDGNSRNIAFIFPDKNLYKNPDYLVTPNENDGCFCPRDLDELGRCLTGCIKKVNLLFENNDDKIVNAAIIDTDENIESEIEKYKEIFNKSFGGEEVNDEVYFIKNL
ncbi:MAG: hypothetical protein HUU47_05060 [Bacteroidetes bacterium]|nr:hypothetical protein [Bacteroidota bacterium]